MARYSIVPMIGTGSDDDLIRPDVTGPYILLGIRGQYALVITPGSTVTGSAFAATDEGAADIRPTSLSRAQRTALKAMLDRAGVELSEDNMPDRRTLMRVVLKQFGFNPDNMAIGRDYWIGD